MVCRKKYTKLFQKTLCRTVKTEVFKKVEVIDLDAEESLVKSLSRMDRIYSINRIIKIFVSRKKCFGDVNVIFFCLL